MCRVDRRLNGEDFIWVAKSLLLGPLRRHRRLMLRCRWFLPTPNSKIHEHNEHYGFDDYPSGYFPLRVVHGTVSKTYCHIAERQHYADNGQENSYPLLCAIRHSLSQIRRPEKSASRCSRLSKLVGG